MKTTWNSFKSFRTLTTFLVAGLLLLACAAPFLASYLQTTKAAGTLQCDITATNEAELKAGVQNLAPGQTLCLVSGIYNMRFDSNADPKDPHAVAIPSGTASQPITITGYDPTTGGLPDAAHRPVIRPQIQGIQDVLLLQDAHDIRIDSLFLDGSSDGTSHQVAHDIVKLTGREDSDGTPISGSTNIIIKNSELAWGQEQGVLLTELSNNNQFLNLRVHDIGDVNGPHPNQLQGFYLNTSDNVVDHCEVFNISGYGILVYSQDANRYATHNIIRNSTFHHNGESGILVIGSPSAMAVNVANAEIYNNVVYGNSYGGIWIGGTPGTPGAATDTKVYNNTVFHNRGDTQVSGIYVDPNSTNIDVQNNISYQNTPADYSGTVDVSKNWPGDSDPPPFVDITNPEAPDLHLTSHTWPQGAYLALVTSDADGGCRPSGTYDMGAYEFGSIPGQCSTWDELQ